MKFADYLLRILRYRITNETITNMYKDNNVLGAYWAKWNFHPDDNYRLTAAGCTIEAPT